MRVFITGGSGFIGSAVIQELISAGHQVRGLARSDANAKSLAAAGAESLPGDLEDLDALRKGAAGSDGVIHCGFVHDFSRFKEVCEIDQRAIEAMGTALAGSDRPLVVSSGVALLAPGQISNEDMATPVHSHLPRVSEKAAFAFSSQGVRVSAIRLAPTTHGQGDKGFVPMLIHLARDKGASAFVGDGSNRWPATHRLDAAALYRLALEKGPGGIPYHAIAETGVPFREIAETIGRGLHLPVVSKSPEEAAGHFGWMASFAGIDCPSSSEKTREWLGWEPKQPGLLADMDAHYFETR